MKIYKIIVLQKFGAIWYVKSLWYEYFKVLFLQIYLLAIPQSPKSRLTLTLPLVWLKYQYKVSDKLLLHSNTYVTIPTSYTAKCSCSNLLDFNLALSWLLGDIANIPTSVVVDYLPVIESYKSITRM